MGAAAAALVALATAPALGAVPGTAALLAASDPFATLPNELRVLVVSSLTGRPERVPLELWRRGDDRALVRFLAPRDRGKYVLRRSEGSYLLTPTARPVKLAPALAPAAGAALDRILALRPSRDFSILSASEQAGLVTFDLEPKSPSPDAPRLRWVVDRGRRLPVRAELRSREGRLLRLVEFRRWSTGARPAPAGIVAKDLLRGGPPLEVEIVALEAREVPEALFDLEDGAARAALPEPELSREGGR